MPDSPLDVFRRAAGVGDQEAAAASPAAGPMDAFRAAAGLSAATQTAPREPAVTGDPLADAQAFAAAGNRDNMDVEEAWGEFAKREPYVGPQEMEQARKEFPFTGDTAREYLARVRGEDERVRLRREAAERSREPGFLEKAGQVVTRIPGAAAELASKMLPTADPTQVGRKRDVRVDPDALAAHALEGFGAISPEERDAAVGRGMATRERMSRQLGWSLANAGAQATGEMAVAGPMFRAFGPGKTMAGMGAASDTENPARGAAVGLFTGKAGTWAAKYLQGPSGNRLRAALAEGFGFTEADFVAGEADALVSGDPRRRRTAEQSLAAFTTGVGQRLLQANPKATEADFQKAVEAEVQTRMGGERGAAVIPDLSGAAETAKGFGRGAAQAAKGAADFLGEVTNRVRGQAGGAGDKIADDVIRARDESIRYEGEVQAPLTQVRRASTRKAADWFQGREYVKTADGLEYAPSRLAEVVEGRAAAPDAETAAVDAALDTYLRDAWNAKAARGFKQKKQGVVGFDSQDIAEGGGVWEPIKPYDGRTRTLPRADTNDFRAIIEGGTKAEWDAVMGAIAHLNNVPVEQVTAKFQKQREALLSEGPAAAETHLASEFTRDLRIPGAVKIGSREVELQETNPRHYIDRFHAENAAGVGMDMVFGQGPDSRVPAVREEYRQASGKMGDFVKVMRAGHGLNPNLTERTRSNELSTTRTAIQKGMGLGRAATLTGSPVWNAPEFLAGNAADSAGVVNNIKAGVDAAADFVSRVFLRRGHTAKVRSMIDRGLKTENVADTTRDIDNTKIGQAVTDLSRGLNEVFSRPVEEGQETQAIGAHERRLAQMGKGGVGSVRREADIQDLRLVTKIDRQHAADFLDGKMTPDQANDVVRRYLNRAAPVTVGANQSPSQKSAAQQHWMTKMLLKFSQYPSTNLRYTAERLRLAGEAIRAKNVPAGEKAAARAVGLGKIGKQAALRAAQGGLSTILYQAVFGSEGATAREFAEIEKNPVGWLAENAGFAVLAGPFAGVARSLFGEGHLEDVVYPYKLARDIIKPHTKDRGFGTNVMETAERMVPPVNAFTDRENTLERGGTGISTKPRKPRKTK